MKTYCVSRHAGAIAWVMSKGIKVDEVLSHLDISCIEKGDVVVGILPVHLAEQVCSRGGRYLALTVDLPEDVRGSELTMENMNNYNANLHEYKVTRIKINPGK